METLATITESLPKVEGVEHSFIDVDGLKMHVATAGKGEPLVLLHGWPQHWYLWRNVIGPLAEHYRVIAPDLRGFGWSDAPRGGYDKRNLAKDIINLLDALGIDDPVKLAGHDWGGFAGFILAINEPRRVERYMALNIPPPWGDPNVVPDESGGLSGFARRGFGQLGALRRLAYMIPLSTPGLSRFAQTTGGGGKLKGAVRKATTDSDAWNDGVLDIFIDQFQDPKRSHATMMLYRTFITREVLAIGRGSYLDDRLTVPTRLLFGADDVAVDRTMIEADHSKMADDLTAEVVEGCGHFIVDEQPELVVDRMLAWFGAT